jgi:hypothetical protein
LQFVSEQELKSAVEADVRQCGLAVAFVLKLWRAKAKETKIGLPVAGAG